VPVLDDGIPVFPGKLVSVPGVPDTEQHAAEVSGVVQESPPEQHSEGVERDEALHAYVCRERVRKNLVDEGETEPRVRIQSPDDADQSHDGTGSTDRWYHARSNNLQCIAGEAGDDPGRQVDGKKLFSTELGGNDGSKRPEDVHVDEEMKRAVVAERGQQHRPTRRRRHRTCHEVCGHEAGELRHAPGQQDRNVDADDAADQFLRRVETVPPHVQPASEIPHLAIETVVTGPGNPALVLLGQLSKGFVLPDRCTGEAGTGHGHGERERFYQVAETLRSSLDVLDRPQTPVSRFRQFLTHKSSDGIAQVTSRSGCGISGLPTSRSSAQETRPPPHD